MLCNLREMDLHNIRRQHHQPAGSTKGIGPLVEIGQPVSPSANGHHAIDPLITKQKQNEFKAYPGRGSSHYNIHIANHFDGVRDSHAPTCKLTPVALANG